MSEKVSDQIKQLDERIEFQHKNSKIMMVDDEPINMEIVQAYLEDEGYTKFILVEKSTEAMDILETRRPDILLLDLMMPEVSGFDIMSQVRSNPKYKHLPILVLTSSTDTETKLKALDLGATDFLAKPVDQSELSLRLRNTLAAKAYVDQLAYYDALTNLPNRELFIQRLQWSITEGQRYTESFALLSIGLNNLSKVNASSGFDSGDIILKEIAERVKRMIRNVDVLTHSENSDSQISFFRTEGSGFSLILNRIKNSDNAAMVAERILEELNNPFYCEDREIFLSSSIGVAMFPQDGGTEKSILQAAGTARDYARNAYNSGMQFASADINNAYKKRVSLESMLRKSIEKDELLLYYQPKVDVATNVIKGAESLIRWNNEEKGMISPAEFIPLAEETGLIIPIGEWIVYTACRKLKECQESDRAPISLSVNLSATQFNDPEFFKVVSQIITSSGIDASYLTLEITESLLIDDVKSKVIILNKFKEIGVKISIDDFGTGYSSFNYLRELPANEIKIDQAFIRTLTKNSKSHAIVSSIIYLSHSLDMIAVSEGIETESQLDILREAMCDQYQGFLFSKPVSDAELLQLLPEKS